MTVTVGHWVMTADSSTVQGSAGAGLSVTPDLAPGHFGQKCGSF